MNDIMKLEEAIEIILNTARKPITNDHTDKEILKAVDVVEDFFVNNVFDDE